MRIVVYHHTHSWSNPWLDAFCHGLRRHGISPARAGYHTPIQADLAVFYAFGQMQRRIADIQMKIRARFIVMEMGYVGDRYVYQSLRFDGLNGRGWCPPAPDGGTRWERLFGDLSKPWREDGDYAVLAGQVRTDQASRHVDLPQWYIKTVKAIERVWPNLPIFFRPHPVAPNERLNGIPALHGDLDDALAGARLVVTFNSNSGVLSALSGVPTITCDEGSMAWPVAAHEIGELLRPDRTSWMHDLAWSQWTIEEMARGDAWDHLRHGVEAE